MPSMKNLKNMWFIIAITAMLLLPVACGGGGGGNTSNPQPINPATYTVGGTITGLDGTRLLVIQNNGANRVSTSKDYTGVFYSPLADNSSYNITVYDTPPGQTCTVTNGSGTIRSANVTNISISCAYNPNLVTLSGKIAVPSGVIMDGSVNNEIEKYEPNETFAFAQSIPNPITVAGYVNWPRTGNPGRSFLLGNMDDYYKVDLKAGDAVVLEISASDPSRNDLDLYLYDYNVPDENRWVKRSVGDGSYEMVTAPSDGTYFVNVYAYSGASNYILTIGADAATASIAAADPGILSSEREIVPDQVIVRFKNDVKATASTNQIFTQYTADLGLTNVAGASGREMLFNMDDLKFQAYSQKAGGAIQESHKRKTAGDADMAGRPDTLLAIKELRKQDGILSAEPNYIVRTSITPNDEHYGSQWHYPMIKLPEAWDITTGSDNVIVAVIDTGVLMEHPDLKNRLTDTGHGFVSGETADTSSSPKDPGNGIVGEASTFHGTHVAGTIAAETNTNGRGVAGVTWNTKIMPVRVLGGDGSGSIFDVMQGIRYAAGLSNDSGRTLSRAADIINMSLGGPGYLSSFQNVINEARAKGVIIIAAAGNENTSIPSYPASHDGVISVSAVNRSGVRASYSNYGRYIDVAAPGGDREAGVYSTDGDDSGGSVVYTYKSKIGTSMATPHMAGVVALMKAVYPGLTPNELDALLSTGTITDIVGGGDKEYYGYGLINARKAVEAAQWLAGGGNIAGIDVNPRTVNFGFRLETFAVTVSKIGTVASVTNNTNQNWLSVVGSDFGTYTIKVDRSHPDLSQDGTYEALVTFTPSSGTPVDVRVTVRVGEPDVDSDAGRHYVGIYSVNNDDTFKPQPDIEIVVKAANGYYNYDIHNVPPGSYLIFAGSDRNNDFSINDMGESFGAYPAVDQTDMVVVTNTDIGGLDFAVGLRRLVSNEPPRDENMAETDNPSDGQSVFKYLRLSGEASDGFRYRKVNE